MGVGESKASMSGLPEGWTQRPLFDLVRPATGQVSPRREPYASMTLVAPDHIESETGRLIAKRSAAEQRAISGKYVFKAGDVVYSKIRPYLRKAFLADFDGLCSADMYPLSPRGETDPRFVLSTLLGHAFSVFAESASARSGIPKVNRDELAEFKVAVPPTVEQRAIASALSDVDALLTKLDQLIAKKRDLKQAAMQQLLTGRVRLGGFRGDWNFTSIGRVCHPSSARNSQDRDLPVLSCSKHLGFVESLRYFKNQVFSDDRRGYKIIRRNEIGYPANHIEEGSIGLQDLFDEALVSPIYVVFRVAPEISSFFLHRLLKLDAYRERFHAATSSSVDRRGSLRWRQFADITVSLPGLDEQLAVAEALRAFEAELAALEARRDKTRQLKQGMMQALLTGRIRLV